MIAAKCTTTHARIIHAKLRKTNKKKNITIVPSLTLYTVYSYVSKKASDSKREIY